MCLVCHCVNEKKKKDTQIGFCLYVNVERDRKISGWLHTQLLPVVGGVRGLVPTHSAESRSGQVTVKHPSPRSGAVLGL